LKYDYSEEEDTSFDVLDGGKEREIVYGSAWTKGFDASDTICLQLDPNTCVQDAKIFVVTDQQGF